MSKEQEQQKNQEEASFLGFVKEWLKTHQVSNSQGRQHLSLLSALSPEDQQAFLTTKTDKSGGLSATLSFCLCEWPEGDWPRIRIFPALEAMVNRIQELDGQEVCVWAFYGLPIQLSQPSRVGRRYLFLPDGRGVPIDDPTVRVSEDAMKDLSLQEDGWLGPPELAEPVLGDYLRSWEKEEDDEDEDEDEDVDEDDDDYRKNGPRVPRK